MTSISLSLSTTGLTKSSPGREEVTDCPSAEGEMEKERFEDRRRNIEKKHKQSGRRGEEAGKEG